VTNGGGERCKFFEKEERLLQNIKYSVISLEK
jgi:hypothetical protein